MLRIPASALRLALGEVASELLASTRALPGKLTAAGFGFQHPDIASSLGAVLADQAG